jgi:GWxTD domain-containing protein
LPAVRPISRSILLVPAVLVAVLAGAPPQARALDSAPLRSLQAPFFTADVSVTMDTLTHASVSVTITVPYSEFNWARVPAGYAAGAQFTVELEPSHRERLYGGSWDKRLLVHPYDATHSSRNSVVAQRSFEVPPGRYKVRLRVRDIGSGMESDVEDVLVLEDLARLPVGFADLQLGVLDSAGTFHPNPTRIFGYDSADLGARVVTFDRRPGEFPRRASLHWRVLDDVDGVEQQGDTVVALASGATPIVVRAARGGLFIGDYTLELERVEGKARWRTSRTFEVEESGPPHGKDYTQMLEALSYIAGAQEVDAMRNLPPEKQADAWEAFWRRRDPTPETPRNEFQVEFFRRLRYASGHFQGFGTGWRSDMGRIYVRYGPPDQIESHPSSATNPATEVWSYNQPYHRFVFVDREGFGRFTLAQPVFE